MEFPTNLMVAKRFVENRQGASRAPPARPLRSPHHGASARICDSIRLKATLLLECFSSRTERLACRRSSSCRSEASFCLSKCLCLKALRALLHLQTVHRIAHGSRNLLHHSLKKLHALPTASTSPPSMVDSSRPWMARPRLQDPSRELHREPSLSSTHRRASRYPIAPSDAAGRHSARCRCRRSPSTAHLYNL